MKPNEIKVLVACEESQTVTEAFRNLGFSAFSCDILPPSGALPEFHFQGDALEIAHSEKWDLVISHPPCTFLTVTGNKWMKPEFRDRFPERAKQREDAVAFFIALAALPVPFWAIENPVGIISTRWRKPDQYVHPYFFGDPHSKKTGLWLGHLPPLRPTKIVTPEFYVYADGRKDPIWHLETLKLPAAERSKARSKTFPGFAAAMAEQWGAYILETKKGNTRK
jgi:hypothetical protein